MYETRFKIKGRSVIKSKQMENDKFIDGSKNLHVYFIFLPNHHIVRNAFDIVKQAFSNFPHKIMAPGILVSFALRFSTHASSFINTFIINKVRV